MPLNDSRGELFWSGGTSELEVKVCSLLFKPCVGSVGIYDEQVAKLLN